MKTFKLLIEVGKIKASSFEEAEKRARELLLNYATSNDGSEVLADADPILQELN